MYLLNAHDSFFETTLRLTFVGYLFSIMLAFHMLLKITYILLFKDFKHNYLSCKRLTTGNRTASFISSLDLFDRLIFTITLANIISEDKSIFQNWVFFFLIQAALDAINDRKFLQRKSKTVDGLP